MNTTQELERLKIENALLIKLLLEKQQPKEPDKSTLAFSALYLQWLTVKKEELQPSTYFEYLRIYTNYIVPYWSQREALLTDMTAEGINTYYRYLKRTFKMSNNSLIRHHANMHTCFKYAYHEGCVAELIMDKVKRPKPERRQNTNYYTVQELLALFEIAQHSNIYTVVLLAAVLGLSRSELLALKWDAINLRDGTVTVKRKMTRDKFSKCDLISRDLKTEARQRTLVMPPFLLNYLQQCRKQIAVLPNREYAEFVCVDANGKLPTLNMITNRFRDFIKAQGLKKITLHQLRHSCASMLHALGYSLKDIQEWLGHSNIQTTANVYTHLNLQDKERVAKGIEAAISSNFPPQCQEVS